MTRRDRIVHIHPTRLCNFRCLHCYSASGPEKFPGLDLRALCDTTRQLRGFGYTLASLSGGEPTLYRDFEPLCQRLTAQGYAVSVISNGWEVSRLGAMLGQGAVHFAAISFDGLAPLHDRIRGRPGAFAAAERGLARLRAISPAVGALVAVTNPGLADLPDLVARLAGLGVAKIQLHPIARIGRARDQPGRDMHELAPEALLRVLLMTALFRRLWPGIAFQCDALPAAGIAPLLRAATDGPVSPLVIDETGQLLPLLHGMPAPLAMGRIGRPIAPPLAGARLRALMRDTAADCARHPASGFFPDLLRRARNMPLAAGD